MASSYYKLEIINRMETRKKGARAIRKKGFIPGVLYYSGEENVNISIEKSVLFRAMQSGQRIFEVDQDGKSQYTMIKQLQYHPVTDDIMHVDLMRVRRSEKMTISVPLVLVGESIGVKEGGVLSQSLNQVEISCYPTDVPEQIELDIEDLELNSSKAVSNIKIDLDNVDIISDPTLNVVSVTTPVEEEVIEDSLDEEGADDVGESEEGTTEDKPEESSGTDSDEKS